MKEELLIKIAEILDVDHVNMKDNLKDFEEWDSLTGLSIIAMSHTDYNKKITNEILNNLQTVEDLANFILA
ncbi:phosphopantetheine-binding protein [Aquirufa antheringensis]|uniref:phosphopantetheine-binding protein n=1 Tax=Aquirufa antheringensis TaxID=2516559 RepID=UPI00191BEAB1|nr:phosphopantetheine-binding protein [Aquirufa antheringensis]